MNDYLLRKHINLNMYINFPLITCKFCNIEYVLLFPVITEESEGKISQDYWTQEYPNYCPYCGESLNESDAEGNNISKLKRALKLLNTLTNDLANKLEHE